MDYTEKHYTSEDGLNLYYREYGQGDEAVLCLPGLTRNSKDFHEIALHLVDNGYRVLCPDLRGRGRSQHDAKWKNYNITVYMKDVRRLMDAADLEQAIFLGTSLGGLISMTMAYQQPARVKAIILNDVGPEIDPVGLARILQYAGRTEPVNNWSEAAASVKQTYGVALPGMPDDFWAKYVRRSYAENVAGVPVLEIDPKIGDAIRSSTRAARILKFLNSIGLFRVIRGVPVDTWESFRAVRMPCLVLRGALSDILSEGIIDHMQEIKPDLLRATIPGRGHVPLLDEPESLAAIDAFLANL